MQIGNKLLSYNYPLLSEKCLKRKVNYDYYFKLINAVNYKKGMKCGCFQF